MEGQLKFQPEELPLNLFKGDNSRPWEFPTLLKPDLTPQIRS